MLPYPGCKRTGEVGFSQIFCPTACLCPVTMFGGSFMNSWFDMNLSGHSGFQERLDILKAANVSDIP